MWWPDYRGPVVRLFSHLLTNLSFHGKLNVPVAANITMTRQGYTVAMEIEEVVRIRLQSRLWWTAECRSNSHTHFKLCFGLYLLLKEKPASLAAKCPQVKSKTKFNYSAGHKTKTISRKMLQCFVKWRCKCEFSVGLSLWASPFTIHSHMSHC